MFRNRNCFEFVTDWTLDGSIEEVGALVDEATRNPAFVARLWPAAFLHLAVRAPGGPDCVGRVVAMRTRGFLPYTLSWQVELTEMERMRRYVQVAQGDLEGVAVWTVTPFESCVGVRLEWRVRANKPLVRWLAFLLRPLFARNHRWAMARGQEAICRALRSRRERAPAVAAA